MKRHTKIFETGATSFIAIAAAMIGITAAPAYAQDAVAEDDGVIVVTAQRREQNVGGDGLARTYIHCINPVPAQAEFPYIASIIKKAPGWRYKEMATRHDALVTKPGKAG